MTKIKATWLWGEIKKVIQPLRGSGVRAYVTWSLVLKDLGVLSAIVEIIFSKKDNYEKIKDLALFRRTISPLLFFAEHKKRLDVGPIRQKLDPIIRFCDLIDWVLMFETAYNIPFQEWEDMAPRCLRFLEQQWRQGPINFEDFYEGEYDIKDILQQRKDQLRKNPEYQPLFLREG